MSQQTERQKRTVSEVVGPDSPYKNQPDASADEADHDGRNAYVVPPHSRPISSSAQAAAKQMKPTKSMVSNRPSRFCRLSRNVWDAV